MSYQGDIHLGDTIDIKFTTRQISGAPFALSGGVISAYVDNGTTEITAGITLSADFDGRTGLNNVRVVASGGNGFAAGTNVQLVITTGTVNSVSVVGEVIGEFSIDARTANVKYWNGTVVATPATAGIPDVNVKNIDNDAASASGTVTFPNATLASTTNISAGTITTVTNLTNAPTAGDFTATMKTSIGTAVAASAVASVTGNVGGNVNGNVVGSVGSVTGNVGGNVAGSVASVTGNVGGSVVGNVGGSVGSVVAAVTVGTNNDKTGYALSAGGVAAVFAGVVQVQLSETYAAKGVAPTIEQAMLAIQQKLFERSVAGTTETINGLDGVTPKMTETINNAVTPTAITRAT